ncbi:hypothetical protein [Streptomyces sp. WM6378]|uniref:hypothetical protein n=1 Tax=Streptomyces sp. WM6378 TaxID=1415557 RepID=UPI00131CC727|nr:hypothetical protein [Streptomyces sp. WM6378]
MHSVRIPDSVQFLRRALALLTMTLKADGGELPALEAVVLSRRPTYVELHLAQPRPPVAPFTADPDRPGVWRCEASSAALRPGEKLEPVVEPYPGLVSLGWDQEGRIVLIDLEYVGVLHLTGDAERGRYLYQALATELATTAFARRLPLAFVGRTATELTGVVLNSRALPADRAASDVRALAAVQRTRLQSLGIDSPRSARPHDQEPASWLGQVVLCHDTRAADLSDVPLLVDTRAAWPQSTMSVVALAPDGVPMPSGAWTLNCSAQDDLVLLPGSGMPVRLHQLDDVGFADVIELLTIGHSTEDVPGPYPANPPQ